MILRLRDESDQEIKDDIQLDIMASNYFCNTFRDESRARNFQNHRTLDEADIVLITAPIIEEKVRSVAFSMGAYKARRPDGFPLAFFQEFWDIVGFDVAMAAENFFRTGKLLKILNNSYIALVSKIQEPLRLTDFRSISLCNTIYKIFFF